MFAVIHLPPLVMYLLQIAVLDKKLLTCSTSSPRVVPAPSWFRPPHLILCMEIKYLTGLKQTNNFTINHKYPSHKLLPSCSGKQFTSHFQEWAFACITDRNGFMSRRGESSGQSLTTLCRYGQYLHITSVHMNCTFLGLSSFWRNRG